MSARLRWFTFDRLLAALVLLTIALACGLTPMHTDSWWQLRSGYDMWQTHRILLTDVHSHTAYGTFWPNHEWGAELAYYTMFRMGGLPLVTLFAATLIVTAWTLSWRLGKGPTRELAIWIGLAVISSSFWWQPRPHAFSLLFIVLTVTLVATWRGGCRSSPSCGRTCTAACCSGSCFGVGSARSVARASQWRTAIAVTGVSRRPRSRRSASRSG
jgi:hypothetical protein